MMAEKVQFSVNIRFEIRKYIYIYKLITQVID